MPMSLSTSLNASSPNEVTCEERARVQFVFAKMLKKAGKSNNTCSAINDC